MFLVKETPYKAHLCLGNLFSAHFCLGNSLLLSFLTWELFLSPFLLRNPLFRPFLFKETLNIASIYVEDPCLALVVEELHLCLDELLGHLLGVPAHGRPVLLDVNLQHRRYHAFELEWVEWTKNSEIWHRYSLIP